MKKKIFMLSCTAAVAIATFVGKKTFESKAFASDALLTQNVEALSSGVDGGKQPVECYNSITTHKASQVRFCGDCSWHDGTYTTTSLSGKCNED